MTRHERESSNAGACIISVSRFVTRNEVYFYNARFLEYIVSIDGLVPHGSIERLLGTFGVEKAGFEIRQVVSEV